MTSDVLKYHSPVPPLDKNKTLGAAMKEMRFKRVYCEISNACNLKCDFCPVVERPKTFMDRQLFESVVKQTQPLANHLNLHIMGEPTIHPEFEEFVDICRYHKMPVFIVTNGTVLNETVQRAMLNPIVHQVSFSIHSFEANFPEADNTTYLNKIFAYTERSMSERPNQYVNFRLWNTEYIDGVLDANRSVVEAVAAHFNAHDKIQRISLRGVKIHENLYINLASQFDWPSMNMPFRTTSGTCPGLITQLGILSDGTVVPCCLDRNGIIELGNVREQSIEQIINSDRALQIIGGFKNRELHEELCQRCTFISRFEKKVRWIKGHQRWVRHEPDKPLL